MEKQKVFSDHSSDYHYQGKLNPLLSSGRLTLRYAWPRTPREQKSSFAKAGAPERDFSNFSCMFLDPNTYFFPIGILIVQIYYIRETSRNKLKKHSVTKNCSDFSLFE